MKLPATVLAAGVAVWLAAHAYATVMAVRPQVLEPVLYRIEQRLDKLEAR